MEWYYFSGIRFAVLRAEESEEVMRYIQAVSQLRRLVARFPPRRPGFEPRSGHMGFLVDKVALGPVFSEYFVSSADSHSTDCSAFIIIMFII
jgi:hypothetical protein